MPKVLIIGLDGGTFDLIKPWVNEGRLPVLAGLLKSGSHGYLRSTIPPMTFPAWNAFMTGKNPGKHGVFDFTEREDNSYGIKFTNALNRRTKTIWQILSDSGKTVATIGVPVTYPPEELNGVVISGFDAPGFNPASVNPPEMYYRIKKNVGEYIISPDISKYIDRNQIDKAIETIIFTLRQRTKVAEFIMKLKSWDCFMIVFMESDVVSHHFWEYHDRSSPYHIPLKNSRFHNPILSVYEELDHAIGKLLSIAPEDTVTMIVSDHGFGGTGDKIIYLNSWLKSKGFLAFKNKNENDNLFSSLSRNTALSKLRDLGTRIIPANIRKKLLYNKIGVVKRVESFLRFSHIDWGQTYAYSEETPYYPTIWINLKGREPEGIVDPENFDKLRDEIIEKLLQWKDEEDNNPLIKNVFKRETIYHGDYVHKAPDLIIDWNLNKKGYSYLSRPSHILNGERAIAKLDITKDKSSKFLFGRSGSHREFGICIVTGKMVKPENTISNPEITDIAPTVLYLLGIPIPKDIDGNVLTSLFDAEYLKRFPIMSAGGETGSISGAKHGDKYYTKDEEEKIKERLKGMGYLS
jgi:predicted AlkP superfamily phosphohydrolase/phosphomutase